MRYLPLAAGLLGTVATAAVIKSGNDKHKYTVSVASTQPYALRISHDQSNIVQDIKILTGNVASQSYQATPVSASDSGAIANGAGQIDAKFVTDSVIKIQIDTQGAQYVGAQLSKEKDDLMYGVWSYPWNGTLANEAVSFELKGIQEGPGINYCNARAPFYLSSAGYGLYIDSLAMGTFNFSAGDSTNFVFNSSSLSVYVVLPKSPWDFKSILQQFGSLSSTIFMPPDSAYGPIIFSDDFNKDFHGYVTNAAENYCDVIDHLYANKIRASAMFADRPYATGNGSWGNFDFNLTAYPDPMSFIQNLTDWGFDFQVWVSNRATPDTLLWNASRANGWQFDVDQTKLRGGLPGPALNLSIADAYNWFADHLNVFTDLGVKGYKIDRGEENEMPVWEQNIQQHHMLEMVHDNMEAKWGKGNFFNFARSANDRSRSHAAVWGGDSHANFTGLAYSVTAGIRAGLIGFSMWGSDTGGYIRKGAEQIPATSTQPPTEEVWARWMQFAAFSPMYELMLGTGSTPWYEYTSDLVRVFAETATLHHELLPYLRSHTYTAHKSGLPIIRPLWLEEPRDKTSWSQVADLQYFFGSELLVAPIVTAGGERKVYFPGGGNVQYLEYINKTAVYQGGETVSVQLGVHDIPVYVKAGSIIPRGDVFRANNRWSNNWAPWLNLEVYPSWNVGSTNFEYYDKGADKVINVTVTSKKFSREVRVKYGSMGFRGNVVVYTKNGPKEFNLAPGGGEVAVKNVVTLFE
ncbi:hypothetical protein GQ53DRAFT_866875 [Thozetella sp. PMI_491]|nr:hypothetical protein GQ53DRAFT_866875 [Thozetella sp. PMI_491]